MSIGDVTGSSIGTLVSLAGRTAVVTGGAMGLGKATARRLAEAGADVMIADIDREAAEATAHELAATCSGRLFATGIDMGHAHTIVAAADEAVVRLGGIDIWINNAGIPSTAALTDIDDEEWDRVMVINLRGTMIGAREAARRMIAAGKHGVIVNIASLAGLCGIAGQATYGASKAGVIGLTRHLSADLAPNGIRVLAIAPGVMLTENKMFIAEMDPETARNSGIPGLAGSPLGRLGVADDIARVVLFCASDLSVFMTGTTLMVDGGVGA